MPQAWSIRSIPRGWHNPPFALPTLAVIVRALGEFAVPLQWWKRFLPAPARAVRQAIPEGPLTVASPCPYEAGRREGRWFLSPEPAKGFPGARDVRAIVLEAQHGEEAMVVCLG